MRLHRFYTEQNIDKTIGAHFFIQDSTEQMRKVFRLKSGDHVIAFDGSGEDVESEITDFTKEGVELSVVSSQKSRSIPNINVTLSMAIVKKDNFELIVEKATELGVSHIIPVLADRSEKKNLNQDRLIKISIEASEQSGRGSVPSVGQIMSIDQFVSSNGGNIVVFDPSGKKFLRSDSKDDITVLIGPEGGWSPRELELFASKNIPVYSLGNQVLRAETAAISVLSLILL
jgi:16S rRNA (uracil1498-N3)-methyltransferase